MKKLLIALGIILLTSNAWAGLITYDSGATLTRSWLNSTYNTIFNEINGSIDTDNLAASAVASDDIATAVNPLVRDFYNIGEYVYSGLTIATSADLSSTITAGVAFIANDGDDTLHLVTTAATAKTFTASKDTWVYLDYTGAFTYDEQALGASQPTTPLNSIVIAKVVTDSDNITSVTDYRATEPTNLRIYQDAKNGLVVSRDITDTDAITISRGDIEFGGASGKVRRNTTTATINFATTGRGGLDTGSLAAGYYYLHAVADDDNDANFEGIASLSSTDATGVTGERLIGWCYAEDGSTISPDSAGAYRGRGGDAPNIATRAVTNIGSALAQDALATLTTIKFYSSGRPVEFVYKVNLAHDAGQSDAMACLSVDSGAVEGSVTRMYTDSLANVNNFSITGSWMQTLTAGEHDIDLKVMPRAAAHTLDSYYIKIEEK